MIKIIDCPCCNGGKLKIELANGYTAQVVGAIGKFPCIVHCKTCNRKIKYAIIKEK